MQAAGSTDRRRKGTRTMSMKHTMTKAEVEAAISKMPTTIDQMLANRKAWLERNGLLLTTPKKKDA